MPASFPAPTLQGESEAQLDPALFDIIPNLHDLISKLYVEPATTAESETGIEAQKPLSPKAFAQEVAALKHKLQRARAAIVELPDIDRTVEEQEVEITRLTRKIATQKKMLREWRAS